MEKKHTEREALPELVEHLDKYERCKNCYHLSSCDVWVRHGTTLYDDYGYSVKNCPYYIPAADVVEVRHGEWVFEFALAGHSFYHCSVCGRQESLLTKESTAEYFPYCHCGAKMDGGDENG